MFHMAEQINIKRTRTNGEIVLKAFYFQTNSIINLQSLFSFEGQLCTCSWVLSLWCRYFYNSFIVKMFEKCFPLMLRTMIYFRVYIISHFPITYRNASVRCQSKCACLHDTVNMVVIFVKSNEDIYQKGRALT